MPLEKLNILRALFDIKPVDDSGRVDVHKIYRIRPVVDLAQIKKDDGKFFYGVWNESVGVKDLALIDNKKLPKKIPYQEKLVSHGELEKYLNTNLNVKKEIKNIGGKTVIKNKIGKPRLRPILNKYKAANEEKENTDYYSVLAQINQRILPAAEELFVGEPKKIDPISLEILHKIEPIAVSSEIESWARYASNKERETNHWFRIKDYWPRIAKYLSRRNKILTIAVAGSFALIFTLFGQYGMNLKNEVMKESSLAVTNLEEAGDSLKVFDLEAASNNFADAYEEFSKAGDTLDFMGSNITSIFAGLPGAGKLRSAKNLVEAGKLLAEAGKSMSEAVNSLSQTSSILKLTSSDVQNTSDIQNIFGNLRKSLLSSGKKLSKVNALLSDVDLNALPEDKKDAFSKLMAKLPELEGIVSDAVQYTGFLENLLGSKGTKKYLVLFQNSSELRPTGGFPGTYAVVTFKDGHLTGLLVDDVYNLDGQLKENYVPPVPLQHITPTWGMRDTAWFIDFSVSAQKAMEFFKKEAGYEVDGVITMNPKIISDILKIVGPIEMPDYDAVIDDKNFLAVIQEEVEYGGNRQQPKKIVMDMSPKLLEKINSADPNQWLDIFNVFISGLDKKDILMYFKDLNLEGFVADKGFGGLVNNSGNDYLMVTLTNIKGSKTDKVIDNSIKVDTRIEKGRIIHRLELTRQHNGGSTGYGFYNKQNPAYVRVLVPDGSELLNISGNSNPQFKPLISYSNPGPSGLAGFKKDDNLFKLESSFHFDSENVVSTYRESGKTGFAFWLITDPGKRKTVGLEYSVPMSGTGEERDIYIQKQPGLEVDNFEFRAGGSYIYNGVFDKDLELRFKLK